LQISIVVITLIPTRIIFDTIIMDFELFSPSLCGVTVGTTIISCPNCRDVPQHDINSPRTCWQCVCGGCKEYHQKECDERQLTRFIIRLGSLQYELAHMFRAKTMIGVIETWKDVKSFEALGGLPGRLIFWRECSKPSSIDPPVRENLPAKVKAQACSVENCVHAISTVSPSLAYWVEGMPLRIRELNFEPNPAKLVVLQRLKQENYQTPAVVHSVLVVLPEADCLQSSGGINSPQLEEVWAHGHVFDPTHWQYDFPVNCETTSDYLWNKTKESQHNRVFPFGRSYGIHESEREEDPEVWAHVREVALRALHETVFKETQRMGGRQALFEAESHQVFLQKQSELTKAARVAVREARVLADTILFGPHRHASVDEFCNQGCFDDMRRQFRRLANDIGGDGHRVVMAAFGRMRQDKVGYAKKY
jgi:hypothetical protein